MFWGVGPGGGGQSSAEVSAATCGGLSRRTSALTSAWYLRSLRIRPFIKFQISMKPSTLPVARFCPSGEKAAHSAWDFLPNCNHGPGTRETMCVVGCVWCIALACDGVAREIRHAANGDVAMKDTLMVLPSLVGNNSSSSSREAALPRKTSIASPTGRVPVYCCHLSACRSSTSSLEGATTVMSRDRTVPKGSGSGGGMVVVKLGIERAWQTTSVQGKDIWLNGSYLEQWRHVVVPCCCLLDRPGDKQVGRRGGVYRLRDGQNDNGE